MNKTTHPFKYIPGLNGIRALAVFFVIIYHYLPETGKLASLKEALPNGKFGVDLFFVLSGFLISTILLTEKKHAANNTQLQKKAIINFYIRRFLRIFPVYYIALFVLAYCRLPDFNSNLPYYLTYTENFKVFFTHSWDSFSHSWSLSVEEQFYILWPFVIIFVPAKYLPRAFILFIMTGPLFSFFQGRIFHNDFNEYVLTPTCFDAFGIGALLAWYYTEDRLQVLKKIIKPVLPFAILLFIYWKLAPNGGHFQYCRRLVDSIISCGMILFCLSNSYTRLRDKLLENKPMFELGKVSYGIYLFHYPLPFVYFSLKKYFGMTWVSTTVDYSIIIILLILVSFLSFYAVEKPFLKLKNKFNYV